MAMGSDRPLPEWLRGRTLKKNPFEIPGDPFIEYTFLREETGQSIKVRRSSAKNPNNDDPFTSVDETTGKTVKLSPVERHRVYLELSMQPPPALVRELKATNRKV